jgi:hypothetical protein
MDRGRHKTGEYYDNPANFDQHNSLGLELINPRHAHCLTFLLRFALYGLRAVIGLQSGQPE